MHNPPSVPTTAMRPAHRSTTARTSSGLQIFAALVTIAVGVGPSQSKASEHDAGNTAFTSTRGFHALPAPLQDPVIPLLSGGVVGPALDEETGSATQAAVPDAVRRPATNGHPGDQQASLVPPPAETWDNSVESQTGLLGKVMSGGSDGGRMQQRRIGIALGLAGIIGILAVMMVVRGASQTQLPQPPTSVLGDLPMGMRRQVKAGHRRSRLPEVEQAAARFGNRHS